MSERKTDDATLIEALRILSRTIKDGDGVIPACLAEAAARLETLVEERKGIPVGVSLSDEEKATLERCRDKYVAQEIDFLKRNDPQHRWLAMWQQSFECLNSIIMKAGGKAKEQERRWIPVGERLPDGEEWVDIAGEWGDCVGWYDTVEWHNFLDDPFPGEVTHWKNRTPGPEGPPYPP